MMDGRIGAVRAALDGGWTRRRHDRVVCGDARRRSMDRSAKPPGPRRHSATAAATEMDPGNARGALKEVATDLEKAPTSSW